MNICLFTRNLSLPSASASIMVLSGRLSRLCLRLEKRFLDEIRKDKIFQTFLFRFLLVRQFVSRSVSEQMNRPKINK